ncbi:MAG: hypothetical protein DRI90_03715 [Deltaproteobacteria bacterium]|nr:MAG: hypothetical protein DRI90_03715 [Deltaproteobacteria bacterium]
MTLLRMETAPRWWFKVLLTMLLGLCLGIALPGVSHAQSKKKQSVASLIKKGQKHFDEQKYEESIQTLSAALMRPGIAGEEKIKVFQLLAYNYIVLQRTEEADGAVRGLLVIDEEYQLPETESPRFRDFFDKVRKDWEDDGKPGLKEETGLAVSKVKIHHQSPAEADPGATISLEGEIDDPDIEVSTVSVSYRAGTKGKFKATKAKYAMRKFTVDIPGDVVEPPLVEYYIEARSKAGLPIAIRGDAENPLRIAVSDSGGVLTSPWFWIPVSIAVVAAIVIPVVIVTTSTSESQVTVNIFD